MKTLLPVLVVVVTALTATGAQAQTVDCPGWNRLVDAIMRGDDGAAVSLTDVGQTPRCYALFLSAAATRTPESLFRDRLHRFEATRSDRQGGTTASGSGSTTIVSQGPVAKVLSVAAEYGALTQSAKDGVVTIRGNLAGVPAALLSQDVFPYCPNAPQNRFCVEHSTLRTLRKVSFGVSFDPSRSQALAATTTSTSSAAMQPVTFSGSQREISAVNVRVELLNSRDAGSDDFRKAWAAKVGALEPTSEALMKTGEVMDDLTKLAGYDGWRRDAQERILKIKRSGGDRTDVENTFRDALQHLVVLVASVRDASTRLPALRRAYSRFFQAQNDLIDSLAEKNVLAVEYAQNRPLGQPGTSNVRVIMDYPLSTTTKVVANAALTFYEAAPADAAAGGRFRDAQAGVQVDKGLGTTAIGPAVFSVAGYFQYQQAAAILKVDPATPLPGVTFIGLPTDAKEIFTKTGNIWLAQAKLSLTPSQSSTTVPISVTWSNRTELIDKPAWRAQVGVSYNLDALFAAATKH